MKSMDGFTKRLDAIAKKGREGAGTIHLEYKSRADTTANFLSGNMLKNDPEVFELTWNNAQPASDVQKIKWLKLCTPAQIDDFRRDWEESFFERDRVALLELSRLLPLLSL